jgi:hypothetical protein
MAAVLAGGVVCRGWVGGGRRVAAAGVLVGFAAVMYSGCVVGPSGQEYFLLTPDLRLCPSPSCGGQFLQAVNDELTHCADGSEAERCYVSGVDWSGLGGAPLQDRSITLVRGAIVSKVVPNVGEVGEFVAEQAWGSVSDAAPLGVFARLADNGLRCFTTPCFSTSAFTLNREKQFVVSDLDTSSVALRADDSELVVQALGRGELIASGAVVGSAVGGRRFEATQLFVLLARACAADADCGEGTACAEDGFCRLAPPEASDSDAAGVPATAR